eukprot:Selendium_serpulae@DN5842_c1_g1_i1.p1
MMQARNDFRTKKYMSEFHTKWLFSLHDVKIETLDGCILHAHKELLTLKSSWFKNAVDKYETVVPVHVKGTTARLLLHYLYTNTIPREDVLETVAAAESDAHHFDGTVAELFQLREAADMFALPELQTLCATAALAAAKIDCSRWLKWLVETSSPQDTIARLISETCIFNLLRRRIPPPAALASVPEYCDLWNKLAIAQKDESAPPPEEEAAPSEFPQIIVPDVGFNFAAACGDGELWSPASNDRMSDADVNEDAHYL